MAEKPGWYRDPSDRPGTYRWWTGQGWTRWLAESDDAPPPEGHDDPRVTVAVIPRGDRQVSLAVRTMLIGVVLLVVVLVVAAAGGAVANRAVTHPDAGATPSDLTATPHSVDAPFSFDETTRVVTLGDVAVTLPEGTSAGYVPLGVFGQGASAQQDVPQPSGAEGWVAMVMFGEYRGPVQLDLEGYAQQVLSETAFETVDYTTAAIGDVEVSEVEGEFEGRALRMTAMLSYPPEVEGDSEGDEVEIVVIELNPAQYAVWLSLVPDNADEDVRQAVQASRDSLRAN